MYRILNVLHYLCIIFAGMLVCFVIENPNDEVSIVFLALTTGLAIGYRCGYLYVKKESESEDEYEDEEGVNNAQ